MVLTTRDAPKQTKLALASRQVAATTSRRPSQTGLLATWGDRRTRYRAIRKHELGAGRNSRNSRMSGTLEIIVAILSGTGERFAYFNDLLQRLSAQKAEFLLCRRARALKLRRNF
jgi:hypothetical protein